MFLLLRVFFPKWGSVEAFCDTRWLGVQHRCRVSVVAGALSYYEGANLAVCVDCCDHISESDEGGVDVHRIASLSQVPMEAGVKYLGFSQLEKEELKVALLSAGVVKTRAEVDLLVSTVAEAQGITEDRVVVVRTCAREKKGSLYFEPNRVNVALSRAKFNVSYYTTSRERDEVILFAERSRDEALRERVRQNSLAVAKEIREVGVDAFYAKFFCLKELVYR